MAEQLLKIQYQCLHPSCQVICKTGCLTLNASVFTQLSATSPDRGRDKTRFKSPKGLCRLGFTQDFEVIKIIAHELPANPNNLTETEKAETERVGYHPIKILKEEHQGVLKKLSLVEEQVRKRDSEGLRVTTAEIENGISLHSIKKEEEVLFPAMENLIPMGHRLIAIMKEDHRELLSLLRSFREGLEHGDILDGIASSLVVNLRDHIRKEDDEFFEMAKEHIDADAKTKRFLLKGMSKAEESHVPSHPSKI